MILMLAYAAGLRVGEVVQLRLADIDRERHVIHVRQGKGNKERYTILSPALVEMLDRYLWAAQPARHLPSADPGPDAETAILPTRFSCPLL